MSCLVFCSFEVGGLPFRIAEILNRHGVTTYYVSLQASPPDHNSTQFHYGSSHEPWDLSHLFNGCLRSSRQIVRVLETIRKDFGISRCLATGKKSYLLGEAGIRYNYWCFGADLDQDSFYPVWSLHYPLWKKILVYLKFISMTRPAQRASICRGDAVMIAPYQQDALRKICPGKKLFFFPHFFKVADYEQLVQQKRNSKHIVCEEIKAEHFFFSSARHFWAGSNRTLSDNKGNDVILRTFAKYLQSAKEEVKLVLVRKGPDVPASEALADELGISGQIAWIPEIKRVELDKYYQGAAVCFGQFGTPVISFAVLEPMANATPCISYCGDMVPGIPFYRDIPPLINNEDPGQIAEKLHTLMSDSAYCNELGYKSWKWVRENCSEERLVKQFLQIFS